MIGRVQIWSFVLILTVGSLIGMLIIDHHNDPVMGAPVSIDDENIIYNATEDHLFEEVIDPIDITGDDLSWNVVGIPSWISFHNGTMYGIPGNDNVGWNNFTIEVTTSSDEVALNISIMVANTLPEIIEGSVAPMAWEDQDYLSRFDLREDGSKWSVSLVMTGPMENSWAQIGRNGTIYGTPRNVHVGNWTMNITLGDGNGGVVWYEYIVTVVNEPPTISVKDFGIVQEWVEEVIDFDCPSEGDGATYYELLQTNLDMGRFDPINGQYTFIPGEDGNYHGYLIVKAMDFFGGSDTFTTEVFWVNNSLPYLTTPLPTTFRAGELYEIDLDTNEDGYGTKFRMTGMFPRCSNLITTISYGFPNFGTCKFFPWNMDVGDHSYLIYIEDAYNDRVEIYWNFTVLENETFIDPSFDMLVQDVSPDLLRLGFEYDPSVHKFLSESPSYSGVMIGYANSTRSVDGKIMDPAYDNYVEIDVSNYTGEMWIRAEVCLEHIDGSYRYLNKTIEVYIPSSEPNSSKDPTYPWLLVISMSVTIMIIILVIVLLLVENVSYAVQMAVFRGGIIDEKPIITLVHDHPGIHFRELLSYSNFSRTDLVSTLIELEKNGTVRPIPDGLLVRFYPTVGSFVDGPLVLNRSQERVAKVLLDRKKIAEQELSDKSGISKKKLEREVSLMELKGALSKRKGKNGPEYYLSSKQKKMVTDWMDNRPR